jgi:alkyldihydroxyacetonephosphate synthase
MVTKGWEKGRFNDPYMRDSMQDFGIMTDTLECCVNWSNMNQVYTDVRKFCKSRPQHHLHDPPIHAYPQGANLYFIFIAKMNDFEEYKHYQDGILERHPKIRGRHVAPPWHRQSLCPLARRRDGPLGIHHLSKP